MKTKRIIKRLWGEAKSGWHDTVPMQSKQTICGCDMIPMMMTRQDTFPWWYDDGSQTNENIHDRKENATSKQKPSPATREWYWCTWKKQWQCLNNWLCNDVQWHSPPVRYNAILVANFHGYDANNRFITICNAEQSNKEIKEVKSLSVVLRKCVQRWNRWWCRCHRSEKWRVVLASNRFTIEFVAPSLQGSIAFLGSSSFNRLTDLTQESFSLSLEFV